jgi:hypothetical protein
MKQFKSRRGQSAAEAAAIIGFLVFFLVITLAAVSDDIRTASDGNSKALLTDMANFIEQQIKIALSSQIGYYHEFTLP